MGARYVRQERAPQRAAKQEVRRKTGSHRTSSDGISGGTQDAYLLGFRTQARAGGRGGRKETKERWHDQYCSLNSLHLVLSDFKLSLQREDTATHPAVPAGRNAGQSPGPCLDPAVAGGKAGVAWGGGAVQVRGGPSQGDAAVTRRGHQRSPVSRACRAPREPGRSGALTAPRPRPTPQLLFPAPTFLREETCSGRQSHRPSLRWTRTHGGCLRWCPQLGPHLQNAVVMGDALRLQMNRVASSG